MATVAALDAGATGEAAARALARFGGVARRFEFRGELGGVTFVDDYAHLPTEVRAALAAARNGDWGRVVAVFQPHRYSRTAEVGTEFGGGLRRRRRGGGDRRLRRRRGAGARGVGPPGGRRRAAGPDPTSSCTTCPAGPTWSVPWRALLRPGDLCLTLGAGDLTSLPGRAHGPPVGSGRCAGRRLAPDDGGPDAGPVSRADDLEALADRLGRRRSATRPLGSRTTYRVGGHRRPGRGGRRRGGARRRGPGPGGPGRPGAGAGQRLEPAGGRRRVRRAGGATWAPGSRRSTIDGDRGACRRGPGAADAGPADGGRRPDRARVGGGRARDRSAGRCA